MEKTTKALSKHLTAGLTFISLLPLVYFIPPWVASFIGHQYMDTVISVAIIVPINSYLFLPVLVKLVQYLKS